MKWLRENATVLGLLGTVLVGLLVIFVEYGPLAQKNEIKALERKSQIRTSGVGQVRGQPSVRGRK